MKIDWMLLAEGIGTDAKGAITAIGIGQNVLITRELPAVTKRAVVVRVLREGDDDPTTAFQFSLSVKDPDGTVIGFQGGRAEIGPPMFPGLRDAATEIPVEVTVPVSTKGEYSFEFSIKYSDGVAESVSLPLFVIES